MSATTDAEDMPGGGETGSDSVFTTATTHKEVNDSAAQPAMNGGGTVTTTIDELEAALKDIRASSAQRFFTQANTGLVSTLFILLPTPIPASLNLQHVIQQTLRTARADSSSGSCHCKSIMPIHSSCYKNAEDATAAVGNMVRNHFSQIGGDVVAKGKSGTLEIVFHAREKSGSQRDEYIPAIGNSKEKKDNHCKVD